MKSLAFFLILPITLLQLTVKAQDTVFVSHSKTTAIQFPSDIASPIIAANNLITQVKEGNLLAIKAVQQRFATSKLEVKTVDGASYSFPIVFSYGRAGRLNKVTKDETTDVSETPKKLSVAEIASKIASESANRTAAHTKNGQVKSEVSNITVFENKLFYKLLLKNRSNIAYDIDFIHFYVRDLKTAKRTVTQDKEVYPTYSLGGENLTIAGKSKGGHVFAFNKFPITKDQALFIEVYEKNGGRHQTMKVKQRDIEKAQPIK